MVLHCKPIRGDWNGSVHCILLPPSSHPRRSGRQVVSPRLLWELSEKFIPEHIAVYGPDNHLRLTGHHETQAIDKFSYGLSGSRCILSACPSTSSKNGYKEPTWKIAVRTPEADPYQIVSLTDSEDDPQHSFPRRSLSRAKFSGCTK